MRKRRLFSWFVLSCITIAGANLALNALADDDDDDSDCQTINAFLVSTTEDGVTTEGVITGDLEGTTMFAIDLDPPPSPVGNSLAYTGSLTITTEDGSFTTNGTGVFEPGPGGLGTQFDRLDPEQGTGIYAGATGELFFNFRTNDAGDGFASVVTGTICLADDDDDDDD